MGDRIAQIRKEKRMTQADLAAKSGLSRFTIIRLERGCVTTVETIKKVAAALDVSVEVIFCS